MTTEDHTQGPVQCEQLGAFVDGELDPAAAAAFRSHLVQCARCQEEMHGLLQLEALAQDSPPLETKQLLSRAPLPVPRRPGKWRAGIFFLRCNKDSRWRNRDWSETEAGVFFL